MSDEKFPPSLKEEIKTHFEASANLVADYSQALPLHPIFQGLHPNP